MWVRRSWSLWLLVAIAAGSWCSLSSGQTPAPQSGAARITKKKFSEPPAQSRETVRNDDLLVDTAGLPSRFDRTSVLLRKEPGTISAASGSKKSSDRTRAAPRRDNLVVPASHMEEASAIAPAAGFGIAPEAQSVETNPKTSPFTSRTRAVMPGPSIVLPLNRAGPPSITGSHLRLQPGETATERSLRLMTIVTELDQKNADLVEQHTALTARLKQCEDQLSDGAREMKSARKELSLMRDEVERLRTNLTDVRKMFRVAEQENAALVKSLGPLLEQLLDGGDSEAASEARE